MIVLLLIGSVLSGVNGAFTATTSRALVESLEARVEDLQRQVQRTTDRDACRSRYALRITDAQAEWLVVFGELAATSVVDPDYDRPAASADLKRISTDLRAAKDARLAYEQDPVVPCPIVAPQSSEGD